MLILLYFAYIYCYALNFQTFAIMNQFDVSEVKHARCHTGCNQVRSAAGGGTNSNSVQSILVCFLCKHHNQIQNALILFRGTISVTHWIKFFKAKQCHWTSFQARSHSGVFFVLDSWYPVKLSICSCQSRFSLIFQKTCSPARFVKTIRHEKLSNIVMANKASVSPSNWNRSNTRLQIRMLKH